MLPFCCSHQLLMANTGENNLGVKKQKWLILSEQKCLFAFSSMYELFTPPINHNMKVV